MFILGNVTCGENLGLVMDSMVPQLTSTLFTIIKIGVPLLLVFFGMLDLGKAVMAQKEDEIKKGQQTFVKRLIAAVIVFLVFFIVQMVISLVAGDDNATITDCLDCFLTGECTSAKSTVDSNEPVD